MHAHVSASFENVDVPSIHLSYLRTHRGSRPYKDCGSSETHLTRMFVHSTSSRVSSAARRLHFFFRVNLHQVMKQQRHLCESSGSVALVGGDHCGINQLGVGVGGPDDEPVDGVDNGEGGEAVARAELVAPAGSDLEVAAHGGGGEAGLSCRLAGDGKLARRSSSRVCVDAEIPGALSGVAVAGALKRLDGPLSIGHHGLGLSGCWGRGRKSGGDEQSADGGSSELHLENRLLIIVNRDYDSYYKVSWSYMIEL
jgi:hypothetical protein